VAVPRNIAGLVGRTPMVELTQLTEGREVTLFAKLESFNPGGSVKDRIGVAMVDAAEAEGRIEPGRTTIVEATSGNTGIALAFVCAAKGYDLVLTLPQGMSREREGLLRPSRSDGNTRLYTDEDLERLEFILNLARDLGVNIAGIAIVLQMRERMEEMNRQMQGFVEYVRTEMLHQMHQSQGQQAGLVPVTSQYWPSRPWAEMLTPGAATSTERLSLEKPATWPPLLTAATPITPG